VTTGRKKSNIFTGDNGRKRLTIVFVLLSICILFVPGLTQAAQTCDRQFLVNLMKNYLAALVAHNPNAVPFDKDIKFTENTANIPVGDGLWVTASGGPTEFQVYAADPVMQQVAGLFMMKENGHQDVLLGVRLAPAGDRRRKHAVYIKSFISRCGELVEGCPIVKKGLHPTYQQRRHHSKPGPRHRPTRPPLEVLSFFLCLRVLHLPVY
jgi:hypothetical protein